MKAICFVAHPDDCIIFALPFIMSNAYDWTIVYLTYRDQDARAVEVRNFWLKRQVSTRFLGFEDLALHTDPNNIDFETAKNAFAPLAESVNLILTHGEYGEYGHPHHILCNKIVECFEQKKVYFADERQYNTVCDAVEVDVEEIPLHKDAVKLHTQSVLRYLNIS